MTQWWINSLNNWKMSLLGLASLIFAVIQASKITPWTNAFTDPPTQMALIIAALGFFGKSQSTTGTASNPRAVVKGEPDPPLDPAVKVELKKA